MWFGANQWGRALGRCLLAGMLMAGIAVVMAGSVRVHKVVKGESLTSVSKKFGLDVPRLASANGLKATSGLRIGQSLVIPSTERDEAGASLPSPVKRAIAGASVKKGRWDRIVIHHSGTVQATVKGMDYFHRRVRRMENGLAYHFVIGNGHGMKDGEIYVAPRWSRQLDGGHLRSEAQNKVSLGVCLVGNFDAARPTAAQMKSLKALLSALETRCGLEDSDVMIHRDINVVGTRCPGKNFPMSALRKDLARLDP